MNATAVWFTRAEREFLYWQLMAFSSTSTQSGAYTHELAARLKP